MPQHYPWPPIIGFFFFIGDGSLFQIGHLFVLVRNTSGGQGEYILRSYETLYICVDCFDRVHLLCSCTGLWPF